MTSPLYIYKKEIDWSSLHLGLNIPISLQDIFYQNLKLWLKKGENKKIKLLLDGTEYPAILTNIYFDETKYPTHKELLQIRWSPNSKIAQKLREIFSNSYSYLSAEKEKLTNKEYQAINATSERTASREISELVKFSILEQAGSFGAGSFYQLKTP